MIKSFVNSTDNNIDLGFSVVDFSEIPSELLLSNRKDLKYIISKDLVQYIFGRLKSEYILQVKSGKTLSSYTSRYYDTEDFLFYSDHHRGKLNRQKVRTRTYEDGKSFLEIKRKDNKGLTHKCRTEIDGASFRIENYSSFLENIGGCKHPLNEKLRVQYDRITLYHKDMNEKLTFDFSYHVDFDHSDFKLENIVLVESKGLKQSRSFFNLLMKEMKIPSVSFSKYCFGLINIHSTIKHNNFISLQKQVKKI
jgi:hypothetical protein